MKFIIKISTSKNLINIEIFNVLLVIINKPTKYFQIISFKEKYKIE